MTRNPPPPPWFHGGGGGFWDCGSVREEISGGSALGILCCRAALLLHQKLVGDEGDEFAIGGFVVLAVDSRMLRILRVFNAFSKTL